MREGVTLFNVNFPSHREETFDRLTRTSGLFQRRVEALRGLVRIAGWPRVRLTLVINALNAAALEDYVGFVRENFRGVSYIAMNWIKVKGRVKRAPSLVPRLSAVRPSLAAALRACARARIRCLVDGVPLCLMRDFEGCSIDADKLSRGDRTYLDEKTKTPRCRRCSLGRRCAGIRRDYLALFGDRELRPA